ncbi:MAG: hypothetical protein RLZZ347_711 [Candidatus Parcubacteria bacterium]|jgi:UPF0755 protein
MDIHHRISELKLFWEEVSLIKLTLFLVFCGSVVSSIFYGLFWRPPGAFPKQAFVHIVSGRGLSSVADELYAKHLIISPFWLKTFVVLSGGSKKVFAGDYAFPTPENLFSISARITSGDSRLEPIKVTIPEGTSVKEMAKIFDDVLPLFDTKEFLKLAESKEGFLFPDTYYFLPNETAKTVVLAMEKNFTRATNTIKSELTAFKKPLKDVVIMASLIEEEARTTETRRIVAGILWKRLSLGMPLQVDAVFPYINGKNTFQLTIDDLAIDSPYNTYKYKGLPVGPISSPGLDALKATLSPIKTPYLFYLSDKEGNMHYAKTFEEHVANKEKYL